ncbi:hypothetical protein [Prevotella pectinovora]|uniref:hypothetical protein n=1 Tax=Prevotella pectinovora TaxID=1602169 RepID=UPI0005C5E2FA|nr:hypothetical protein [Prevotella pectinovora]
MATATLLDGDRHTVGWLPPHGWMATATRLDGYRHTVVRLPPHFVVNLSHRLNNKDEISSKLMIRAHKPND